MADEETPKPPLPAAVRIRLVADDTEGGGGGGGAVIPVPTQPPAVVIQPPSGGGSSGGGGGSSGGGSSNDNTAPPPPAPIVLDWWQKLAIETRTQLEAKLAQIQNALDIANQVLQETLGRLASVEQKPAGKGDKGDKGEPGTNGTNGSNGRDGTNGRDGKDGSLFVATPEFAALSGRIDTADNKAAIAQSSADAQSARNNTQDASIKQLRDTIANLSSGAPVVPVGPTATEIASAVSTYLKNNPISNGINGTNGLNGRDGVDGKDGKGVSLVDITAAVNEKINSLDFTDAIRKLIPAPVTTSPVTNIIGVTADEVKSAIAASLKPLDGLLTDSEAFVWGMILNASDEFWALFLERLDQIDFEKGLPQ